MSNWKRTLAGVLQVTQMVALLLYLALYYPYWEQREDIFIPRWWAFEIAEDYVLAAIFLSLFKIPALVFYFLERFLITIIICILSLVSVQILHYVKGIPILI